MHLPNRTQSSGRFRVGELAPIDGERKLTRVRLSKSVVLIPLSSVAILAGGLAYCSHRLGSLSATLSFLQGERILVDHPVQALGRLPDKTQKRLVYRLTNLGSAPVRIIGLHSTCSCLIPGDPPDFIGPGESALSSSAEQVT